MKKILIIMTLIISTLTVLASDLIIESKTQVFSDKEKKIKLDGGVKVKMDNLTVESPRAEVSVRRGNKLDTATFYDKPYAFEINANKKREVKANILKVSLINKVVRAEGESQSSIIEGNTPIVVINADEQEYDTKSNIMVAIGKVSMRYKDIESWSDKAVIVADPKGGLKKLDLIGNAKVKREQNVSEGHHFVYNPLTEEMSVTGNTKTTAYTDDGKKLVLHADYQQYNKNQNSYIGNGHVKIWFDEYYAQGPKVSVFPDVNTGKLNEVYFIGRSKIIQQDKDIVADKIKLTLDPKDFQAEGNVRTIIHDIETKENNL
jgi:lipopolysaccharide export system protein LptA